MNNWLRWILVLPTAVGAYIVVQVLNVIINPWFLGFGTIGNLATQLFNSFAGPVAFIITGAKVAPNHRFFTGLVLAALHTLLIGGSLMLSIFNYNQYSTPTWLIVLSCVVSLIATAGACAILYQEHIEEKAMEERTKEWTYSADE